MPFEKNFQRLSISSIIIKIPEFSKRWSIEKNRKHIKKEREKKEKGKKEKEKLQESLQIKRRSQYLERRKIL
jgi:ATP/ADP translocase